MPQDVREIGREVTLPALPSLKFSMRIPRFNDSVFVGEAAEGFVSFHVITLATSFHSNMMLMFCDRRTGP